MRPTVASLVPSATDLLLESGLGGHLVAVSNFCQANPGARGLPSVGDYQSTDWERLTALRPDLMLVFIDRDRLPAGMKQRAAELGITLEVVKAETVADVGATLLRLGELVGEPGVAAAARERLLARLAAVRGRVAGRPRVRTLLVLGTDGKGVIGPGGFLDELLDLAGGINAAAGLKGRYPSIDGEQLIGLAPQRILHLLPGASAAEVAAVRERWSRVQGVPAARNVTILTDWYLLLPGAHLGEIAETLADTLHGPEQRVEQPPKGSGGGTGGGAGGSTGSAP